jgi:hypothetical protein
VRRLIAGSRTSRLTSLACDGPSRQLARFPNPIHPVLRFDERDPTLARGVFSNNGTPRVKALLLEHVGAGSDNPSVPRGRNGERTTKAGPGPLRAHPSKSAACRTRQRAERADLMLNMTVPSSKDVFPWSVQALQPSRPGPSTI